MSQYDQDYSKEPAVSGTANDKEALHEILHQVGEINKKLKAIEDRLYLVSTDLVNVHRATNDYFRHNSKYGD